MPDFDPTSLTWLYIKNRLNNERQIYMERLISIETDPRNTDFLRGQIAAIDNLLSLPDEHNSP